MSQKLIGMEKSYMLNLARAKAAIEKHDKLCKVMQDNGKVPYQEDCCTCTEFRGNWNCKFNNW